jgi:hypothetical protein
MAVVGVAGLALFGCGQQGPVEVAKEETRTTSIEPNKIPAGGSPLRVEAGELKVLETVEKASGKVISAPRLKGTLKLENVGADQTLRLIRGEVAYIGGDGKAIPLGTDQEKPALTFTRYGSSESLDPGQKNDQAIDVAYPAGAAAAKSVKHIRIHVTYVSSPHKTQNFDIPVKIQ